MLKNKWFLSSLIMLFAFPAWSAKGLSLYNGKAVYTYAYPEAKASVAEQKSGSRALLSFTLAGELTSGAGVGISNGVLGAYKASGALQFFVSGTRGGEQLLVGLTMAKEKGAPALQVMVPLANYASLKKGGWSKITIPLSDFPAKGSRWNPKNASVDTGPFNWDKVVEFTVSTAQKTSGKVQFFITNLGIAPSYNGAALKAARKNAAKVTGTVTWLSSAGPAANVGAYAYPEGKASARFAGGKLAVKLDSTVWSGGGLDNAKSLDLSSALHSGKLIVQAAGASGGEVINLGLRCKSNGSSVQVSINAYLPGGLKKGHMATITIPLKDFGATGSSWDAEAGQNVEKPFDWSTVNQVLFDNAGPSKGVGAFYLGLVQIKP